MMTSKEIAFQGDNPCQINTSKSPAWMQCTTSRTFYHSKCYFLYHTYWALKHSQLLIITLLSSKVINFKEIFIATPQKEISKV